MTQEQSKTSPTSASSTRSSGNGKQWIEPWRVSLVAFGHPSDPTTFSGYSASLAGALREEDHLKREYSTKQMRWADALSGAARLRRANGSWAPQVRREWLWSRRGHEKLSRRLMKQIRLNYDHGPFLEVGTLVQIERGWGRHYMLTDMTIPQACRAGHFAVAVMNKDDQESAIQVQAECLESAAHIFVLSQWTANSVIKDFGIPKNRVTVVYAGSNLAYCDRSEHAASSNEILFVGLDWKRKGGPLLYEAFRRVQRRIPSASLRIVGCQPDAVCDGMIVEGYLSRKDPKQFDRLRECYSRASCFCLPSEFDPFPNALIEAAANGIPAVAIANGSRNEAILNGETGILVDEPCPTQLSEALCNVLEDDERRNRMSQRAIEHCETNFTWKRVVSRIGAVIAANGAETSSESVR